MTAKAPALGLALGTLVVLGLLAATPVPAQPSASGDVQDIVFLGDGRPVLIRLHTRMDGQPFLAVHRTAWDDYLKALFQQLDQDGDGFLSETEAQRLPPPQLASGGSSGRPTNVAFNFRVVDTDGNGKLDLTELAAYYRDYGSSGLQVSRAPRVVPPAAGDALFNRLDTNRDGKLSQDELAAAETVLWPLDADGDELLTLAEIVPAVPAVAAPLVNRAMAAQVAAPATANSPFVFLGQGVDGAALARRILERYGPRAKVAEKKLSREELGLDAATFDRLDTNKDAHLDAGELEKFADRAADVELLVRLGKGQPGETALEAVTAASASLQPTGDGAMVLTCGNTRIELRVNGDRPHAMPHLRQQYLAQFHAADIGKKGHLTFKDAQVAGFFPGQFTLLDQNGDGQLTEKELLTYLDQVQERQARALTSVVSVLVSEEGQGLFDLLDRNRDGKLGLREVRGASRLLAQLGKEKEGLARGDVPRSYQVAIGLCQASFNRAGGQGVLTPRGMPLLTLDWSRPNLIWFHKMDRNHDGDISPREFLGSREDFRRLDTDGDGLISLEEALQAEKLFPKQSESR